MLWIGKKAGTLTVSNAQGKDHDQQRQSFVRQFQTERSQVGSAIGRRCRYRFGIGTQVCCGPRLQRKSFEYAVLARSWRPSHGRAIRGKVRRKGQGEEYVGGDQLLAIVNSTPPGTYDVILADAEVVEELVAANQIVQLNPNDYAFDQYWPQFERFEPHWHDGKLYAVMLRFGYLGIAYNSKLLSPKDVEFLQGPLELKGQRQGRLVRLVPAEHGGVEPLSCQPSALRHQQCRI